MASGKRCAEPVLFVVERWSTSATPNEWRDAWEPPRRDRGAAIPDLIRLSKSRPGTAFRIARYVREENKRSCSLSLSAA